MLRQKHISPMDVAAMREGLRRLLPTMKGKKIVVVGDIGLDEYVMGQVRRISPEAPVPVLEVSSQDSRLGLAANVAQNVASLGGEPLLVSVVGQDRGADELRQRLESAQVSPRYLVVDPSRPTTRKMRVMAEHHHLVRVDFELKKYLGEQIERALLAQLAELIPTCDGVVIEDYSKGVLSEAGIQAVIKLAHQHKKKVLVDPNRSTPVHFYNGVDLMTPNREEAVTLSGLDYDDLRASDDFILQVGSTLLEKVHAEKIIVTRGKEGMSLFDRQEVTHLPTYARQVFDVTGAGDTVIAALALSLAAGAPLAQACVLANFAAGVVVGKVGCVPCPIDELLSYMDSHSPS